MDIPPLPVCVCVELHKVRLADPKRSQKSTCLFTITGITNIPCHDQLFMCDLRIQTQVLTLEWQVLHQLSYLLSILSLYLMIREKKTKPPPKSSESFFMTCENNTKF